MEMRIDDQIDARRVAADRLEPRADLFARIKADPERHGRHLRSGKGSRALRSKGAVLRVTAAVIQEDRAALGPHR
jgi:hypothetical protein